MSDLAEIPAEEPAELSREQKRCPQCDSVIGSGDDRCLMCGQLVAETAVSTSLSTSTSTPPPEEIPKRFESAARGRKASALIWLTAVFGVVLIGVGALIWRSQRTDGAVAQIATETPVPPMPTLTLTWTPLAEDAQLPTKTPVATAVPSATPTLQPPRPHTVAPGETLIGLALRFRISVESIAELNGMAADDPLLADQPLQIPWPTPTPPLVSVATLINGETVIADPTDCERYEIKTGDSLSAVAVRYDVDVALFLLVNRLTEESIPQPGDVVCIPEIVYGGSLPPTPGPSPTPTMTAVPAGPQLLYPVANAEIEPPDGIVTFQWAAVKTLAADEWYMVEVTDLADVDGLPQRGFTRDTAFQAPGSWRPSVDEAHTLRWRVSIVEVTGRRADGLPIYTYGGESSRDAFFGWLGAAPE